MGGMQIGQGGGGGAGGLSHYRPAEDVIEAISRLNSALSAAAKAGWIVSVSVGELRPNFAGEGAVVPTVTANLQKQV